MNYQIGSINGGNSVNEDGSFSWAIQVTLISKGTFTTEEEAAADMQAEVQKITDKFQDKINQW